MTDDARKKSPPLSLPPAIGTEDISWDDDTVPRLDVDPSLDRVTAIPELPSEFLAKQMMAHAEERVSGAVELNDSEPPRRDPRTRSTAPPRARDEAAREPLLEIDENALDSAVAARGRWQRPAHPSEVVDGGPSSLELDLGTPEQQSPPSSDPALRELTDRYATGDYSGALVIAEGILDSDPGHAEALRFAKNCRDVLSSMYSARLGSLDQVVSVGVPGEQIRWLSLDHRAGFLLSLVDGNSTLEEILDMSGMPRLDALRIMFSLLQERVITLSSRR